MAQTQLTSKFGSAILTWQPRNRSTERVSKVFDSTVERKGRKSQFMIACKVHIFLSSARISRARSKSNKRLFDFLAFKSIDRLVIRAAASVSKWHRQSPYSNSWIYFSHKLTSSPVADGNAFADSIGQPDKPNWDRRRHTTNAKTICVAHVRMLNV